MDFAPNEAAGTKGPVERSFVTARDLSRRTSELLDAIREGEEIAVTRHGMPVALVIPYEPSRRRAPDSERSETIDWRTELEGLELSTLQERILTGIDSCLSLDRIAMNLAEDPTPVAIAVSGLEIARLSEKRLGGYVATQEGRRVAAALEARDRAARDGPDRPAPDGAG